MAVKQEEERIGSYYFRVRTEQPTKPKPRDILSFDVTVIVRYHTHYFSRLRLRRASTLLETLIPISCESFFENDEDFLRSSLSNPRCSRYFIPERLDQISQRIISRVQQLLLELPSDPEPADSECQEFPLALVIFVDMVEYEESDEDEEIEGAVIEESMQQGVTMIPASNEAINSLKPFTDSLFLKTENCNISNSTVIVSGSYTLVFKYTITLYFIKDLKAKEIY
ncbi:E3 ubiquitin-protein ligase RING [Spatholobus suberectus]|nr:E3 ubiquitin-protein ligase RING [Spatholobus suberectus]